jgi:hypothetical protein
MRRRYRLRHVHKLFTFFAMLKTKTRLNN